MELRNDIFVPLLSIKLPPSHRAVSFCFTLRGKCSSFFAISFINEMKRKLESTGKSAAPNANSREQFNTMTEMHVIGGRTSVRGNNGNFEDGTAAAGQHMDKRPRYTNQAHIDMEHLRDCVSVLHRSIEVSSAMSHMGRFVLDGGVIVQLGGMIQYPGYNVSMEDALINNCHLAIRWRMAVGFVPFFKRRRRYADTVVLGSRETRRQEGTIVGPNNPTTNGAPNTQPRLPYDGHPALKNTADEMELSNDDNSDESDAMSASQSTDLEPADIEFGIPELGYGTYGTYLDNQDYRIKVDYKPTSAERADPDLEWYVYTVDPPVTEYFTKNGEFNERIRVSSPAARLLPFANQLDQFRNDDLQANKLATMPVVILQPRPPVKGSVGTNAQQQAQDLRNNLSATAPTNAQPVVGLNHVSDAQRTTMMTSQTHNPTVEEIRWFNLARQSRDTPIIDQIMSRQLYIPPTYEYAGLVTPHAYPRLSDRHLEFLTNVSIEFGIPSHVILPGKTISAATSSGMSGASAGGKKQQAAGSHASAGLKDQQTSKGGSGGNNFSADPSFNKALELRDFIKSFFQAVMTSIAGDKVLNYVLQNINNKSREHEMREALISELDQRIVQAQDAVMKRGDVIQTDRDVRRQIDENALNVHAELSKPSVAIPKAAPAPASNDGAAPKPVEPPVPAMPMPEPASASSPEVQELTQRRLSLVDDMRAISAALHQLHNLLDKQTMVTIAFRQPFVNDTGNIGSIIDLLKLPEEQGQAIAQRRFGLSPQ